MLLGGAASFPLGLVPIPLNQYFMLKMLLICKLALMLCFLRSHKVLEICKFHTQYHGVIPAIEIDFIADIRGGIIVEVID